MPCWEFMSPRVLSENRYVLYSQDTRPVCEAAVLHVTYINGKGLLSLEWEAPCLSLTSPYVLHWTQVQQHFLRSPRTLPYLSRKPCLLLWSSPHRFCLCHKLPSFPWKHWHFATEKLKKGGFLIAECLSPEAVSPIKTICFKGKEDTENTKRGEELYYSATSACV